MSQIFLFILFFQIAESPIYVSGKQASGQNKLMMLKDTVAKGGQKDFDFEIGTWKTHLKRLQNPLSGSSNWIIYDGVTVVKKVLNGKANLVELNVKGPSGKIEGLSLRLYQPETKQWSLHFANINDGILAIPAVGSFNGGRGEFYNEDTFNGQKIIVRFIISEIKTNSCHFEQAFSTDNGKTWEINWIADDTRIKANK
jgi:hypothetical protein